MPVRITQPAPDAYLYPLLIKQLLHAPLATASTQEIVYRDRMRYTYAEFRRRLGRLGNALTKLGVECGTTVAVLDWDSHRYLECYFAVPMLGAVLQTVNLRLAAEDILYTLQDSAAEVILVNREFVPVLTAIRPQLGRVKAVVLMEEYPHVVGLGSRRNTRTCSRAKRRTAISRISMSTRWQHCSTPPVPRGGPRVSRSVIGRSCS
jgi:fatty-acyl-CoA synthase